MLAYIARHFDGLHTLAAVAMVRVAEHYLGLHDAHGQVYAGLVRQEHTERITS